MSLDPIAKEVRELIKGRKRNDSKSKSELLFDSSDDENLEGSKTEEPSEEQFSKMTELEREAYIFEIEQAKQSRKERLELERRIMKMEQQSAESSASSKQATYESKLRKMEQLRDSKKKRKNDVDSDYSDSEEDHEVVEKSSKSMPIILEDILALQIRRDYIENGIFRPSFADTIQGCFARINVGRSKEGMSVYRLCQILRISQCGKQYTIGKITTNLKATLCIGSSQREANLDIFSNNFITLEEFEFWKNNAGKAGLQGLTDRLINRKKQQLHKFVNNPIDEDEIKVIIENKRATGNVKVNLSAEKAKLLIDLEEARSAGSWNYIRQIEQKIEEINNEMKDSMNHEKSSQNFPIRKLFTGSEQVAISQGELDPFMRRKCKTLDAHLADSPESSRNDQSDANTRTDIQQPQESNAVTRTPSVEKLVAAHNFELEIDI